MPSGKIGTAIQAYFDTLDASGALVDADAQPTGVLYDGATALANTITITHPPTQTGKYVASIDSAGLTADKEYLLRLAVTVDGEAAEPAMAVHIIDDRANLTTQAKADVNTEADQALADYGALKPTVAGRTLDVKDTGEAGLDFSNVFSGITTDLFLRSITLSNLNGSALTLSAGPTRTALTITGGTTGIFVSGGTQDINLANDTITAGAASFTFTSLVALIAKFSGITSVANWIRSLARKSNNDATAVSEINADNGTGTGTYSPPDDSQEAIKDSAVTADDVQVVVTPYVAATSNPRYTVKDIRAIPAGSAPSDTWTIVDATGAAVDLSGKALRFVVAELADNNDDDDRFDDEFTGLWKYESGDGITVGGAGNNVVTVTHSAENDEPGEYYYWLVNVTDGNLVLARGKLPIEPAVLDV